MAHNEGSPIYASDLVRLTFSTAARSRRRNMLNSPLEVCQSLYADLSQPSWEIRRRAHLELLRRGDDATQAGSGAAAHRADKTIRPVRN